jgi:hypothetical protein
MKRSIVLGALTLAAALASGAVRAADMPGEIEQVPLYPGAKLVPPDPYYTPPVPQKEYIVDADVDKVYEFYRKQYPASLPSALGGTEGNVSGKQDARHIGDGSFRHVNGFGDCVRTAKVPAWDEWSDGGKTYQIPGTGRHYSAAESLAMRRKMRGARPNDQWREGANLHWCLRPDARNFTELNLVLRDASFDYNTTGRPRTGITILRRQIGSRGSTPYSSADGPLGSQAQQSENDKMMEQMIDGNPNLDAATKASMKAQLKQKRAQANAAQAALPKQKPSAERDTDIPVYPGALLDTKATDSMGVMGAASPFRNYLYYSEDDLAKVKAFYLQRADRKAAPQGDSRTIVLRQGPNPQAAELTVTLKPASGAGMKTEIMIRKVAVQ